jgi:hypothetical protein
MEFSASSAAAAAATAVSQKTNMTDNRNISMAHQNLIRSGNLEVSISHHPFVSNDVNYPHHQQPHNRHSSTNSLGSFSFNGGGSYSENSGAGGEGGGLDLMNSSWNGDAVHGVDFLDHNSRENDTLQGRHSAVIDDGQDIDDLVRDHYQNSEQQQRFSVQTSHSDHEFVPEQQLHQYLEEYPSTIQPQPSPLHHPPSDIPPSKVSVISANTYPNDLERTQMDMNLQAVESMRYEQQQRFMHNSEHRANDDVIELLDDSDEEDSKGPSAASTVLSGSNKRPHPNSSYHNNHKKATPIQTGSTTPSLVQHYHLQDHERQRQTSSELYIRQHPNHHKSLSLPYGQAAAVAQLYNARQHHHLHHQYQHQSKQHQQRSSQSRIIKAHDPVYLEFSPNHTPTWSNILPPLPAHNSTDERKRFELSLLNVQEFTITGLTIGTFDGRRSSVLGFRKVIKEVSRGHGKAVFERDKEFRDESGTDGGKWRIPLGAYRALYNYFRRLPNCHVDGIPEEQLRVASLGRARLEKGYPSIQKIIAMGVPKALAHALAPFQRGGVDFVKEKHGRALIADGK